MNSPLPAIRVQPVSSGGPSRRSFLRYTGASVALGSLWLASCSKKEDPVAAPTITSFTPTSGMAGTTVTVTGTALSGATAVMLGALTTTFTTVSATSITFTVPAAAPSGTIKVTTPAGTASSSTPFTVTATPPTAPTITSFAPASAEPGTVVTVTGTNFTGATSVTLNGITTTLSVTSSTTLTFVVPTAATAGVATIVVTGPGGTGTNNVAFTVLPSPITITSIAPASALPGAVVTVTGTNFTGVTSVTVDGLAATPTVVNATTLTFVVPAAAMAKTPAAPATIVLTSPSATATNNTAFTVLPTTVNVGSGDVGVLNYVYALEQLEAAFYTQVRTGAYYTLANSAEKQVLDDLYYHEVIHREFLKAAIAATGTTPLIDLKVDFSTVNFNDRTSTLGAAKAFEDLGSAAYIGAGQYLSSAPYLYLAGKIASVEARHASLIRDLVTEGTFVGNDVVTISSGGTSSVANNNGPAGSSLERALSPTEVVAVANLYLAPGSKLDVSGIR